MGPTNVALVKYFRADQEYREALAKLDAASKDVRVQDRRVHDLAEKHKLASVSLKQSQARAGQMELELKTRDIHIEKLRTQQQLAKNNKEYQAFLVEISTSKVDRNKLEDETMKLLEAVERGTRELQELVKHLEVEQTKLAQMKEQIGGRLSELQAEVDAIKPRREDAAVGVPIKAREMFDRMADRFDGEAMSAVSKPDRRREEYVCTSCMMDLVIDTYNKLHSRDELFFCPSCRRILYIPEDLPPETAIAKKKPVTISKKGPVKARLSTRSERSHSDEGSNGAPTGDNWLLDLLTAAAGESVMNAVAAGNDPIQCDVSVDGKLIGTYKGQNPANLERVIKFRLTEAGKETPVQVVERSFEAASGEALA